jgi:hypothetical protein
MPVTEKPLVFEAHGVEFSTKEEAENYDKIKEAAKNLANAQSAFKQLATKQMVTADGVKFQPDRIDDYYYISEVPYDCMPRLVYVKCWRDSIEIELGENSENATISVWTVENAQGSRYNDHVVKRYKVSDLYRSKPAALKALLAIREKWLEEQNRIVDRLRESLSP